MTIDYTSITTDSVAAAVEAAIARGEGLVDEILSVQGPRTFANTLRPFEEVARLGALAYGRGPFLGQVATDEAVRTAAREGEERLEKWALDLISRRELYRAIRDYAGTDDAAALAGEPARALDHALRDFRMAGHELSEEDRSRVRDLLTRWSAARSRSPPPWPNTRTTSRSPRTTSMACPTPT